MDREKLTRLHDPFPPAAVHWRVQGQPYPRNGSHSAMALAYIDARDVMDRLDEVCGPGDWQAEYVETAKGRVICRLGVRVGDEWVWKSDGAGNTAVEGEKGGISDALKRAAVAWGVGRYLYRLDSPWVQCEVWEKNGKKGWKAWAEDPWSKVKRFDFVPPVQPVLDPDGEPQPEREAAPQVNHPATRDRIKGKLERVRSLPDLVAAWKAEWPAIQTLPQPMQNELTATKDARKAALGGNNAQAPQDGDPVYS